MFSALGLVPAGPRPSRASVFGSLHVDAKFALNILGTAIFAALFALTARRGATDPVCGMTVDRAKAVTADFGEQTLHFCSERCRATSAAAARVGDAPRELQISSRG
jgi:hypothetical protein